MSLTVRRMWSCCPENMAICTAEYDDSIYLGNAKNERYYQFTRLLDNKNYVCTLSNRVQDISYSHELLNILEDMFNSVRLLRGIAVYEDILFALVQNGIILEKDTINAVDRAIEDTNRSKPEEFLNVVYKKAQEVSLKKIMATFFTGLADVLQDILSKNTTMKEFVVAESDLNDFCNQENLKNPEILFNSGNKEEKEIIDKALFSEDLLSSAEPILAVSCNEGDAIVCKKLNRLFNNVRFKSVCLGSFGNNKKAVIEAVSEIKNIPYRMAEQDLAFVPRVIKEHVTEQEAEEIKRKLEALGATVY